MRRKILSSLIILAIILSSIFPCFSYAEEIGEDNQKQHAENENISVKGTNQIGNLIATAIENEQQENQSDGYIISNIEMDGKNANIKYNIKNDATLIISMYSEDGKELKTYKKIKISKDNTQIVTEIKNVPQYYLLKAFIVDEEMNPLCKAYESSLYTQDMQQFLKKTTDDFPKEDVLNLDNDKTNNYAIYKDEIKVMQETEKNKLSSVDEKTSTYNFENIDSNISSLKQGDTFSYKTKNNDYIFIKVKSIKTTGNKAVITSEEIRMEDMFDYVKLEGEGNDSNTTVEKVQEEGYTYADSLSISRAIDSENKISHNLALNFKKKISDNNKNEASVSIGIKDKIELSFNYYLTPKNQEVDFSLKNTLSVNGEVSGKIGFAIPIAKMVTSSPIPGVYITFTPSFVGEFSGKMSLNCTGTEFEMKLNINNGKYDFNTYSTKPTSDFPISQEATFKIGLSLEPKVKVISEVLTMGLETQAVLKVSAKPDFDHLDMEKVDSTGLEHSCKRCIKGELGFEVEGSASVALCKYLTQKITLSKNYKISDWYYSVDHKKFGWSTCPYKKYNKTEQENPSEGTGEIIASGKIRNGVVEWTLDDRGLLLVYTVGLKPNASTYINEGPWEKYLDKIVNVKITGNITHMFCITGTQFVGCKNLKTIELPESLETLEARAFEGCSSLEKIVLPKNLKNGPGPAMFKGCTKLKKVEVDSRNENFCSINGVIYTKDKTKLVLCPYGYEGSLEMPDTCTTIENACFEGFGKITNIKLSNKLTNIPSKCFYKCNGIQSITIPNSVTSIGRWAFAESGFKEVKIPESVTKIQDWAFQNTQIERIEVPSSVTEIGPGAFTGNNNLKYAKVLAVAGSGTFSGCENLAEIDIEGKVKNITNRAFYGCKNLKTVNIKNVETIETRAFEACSSLSSLNISEGLRKIETWAFSGTDLSEIRLPDSVEYIENAAFYNTGHQLNKLILPKNLKQIGETTFPISSSAEIYFTCAEAPKMGRYIFNKNIDFSKNTPKVYYPNTWTTIPEKGFSGCEWIPYTVNTVKSINSTQDVTTVENIPAKKTDYNASFEGSSSTEGKYKKSSFEGLVPNEEYIIIVNKKNNPDELLYIDQKPADEQGKVNFTYLLKENIENAEIKVHGKAQGEVTLGDLNGDKKINTNDARVILQYYGGKQTLSTAQMEAGDINKDGKINTADARKVLEFYSGKIKQF